MEISFSSERACDTMYGPEILEHSAGAVDLTRIREAGSLLYNHSPQDVRNVIGRVLDVWVDEDARVCRASVEFDADEHSELVFSKVKSGSIKGVSVGYCVGEYEEVREGQSSRDGFAGPCMIARRWTPLEISITPVPADPSVGPGRNISEGGVRMEDIAKLRAESADDVEEKDPEGEAVKSSECEDDKDDAAERALAVERRRAADITDVCGAFGLDPSEFIRSGATVDMVNAEIVRRKREEMKALPVSRSASAVTINRDENEKFRSAVIDGLSMRAGVKVDAPAPGAEEFRGISLLDLARLVLERGGDRASYGEDKMSVAARAFTTGDFPLILSNLANKSLLAQYDAYPSTWQAWCAKGSLSDFKEAYKARFSEAPELEPVLEGGEYKMAEFRESQDGYKIATYGKKFALTRQMIINDDLNAFSRIPSELGLAAARTVNSAVYRLLVGSPVMAEDGQTLFHANHNNIGTQGALSTNTLNEARVKMRRQRGLQQDPGVYLNLTPAFLIVPPELETTARQLLSSSTDIGQDNPGVINPFQNSMQIVVEPALIDPKAWYVVAAPSQIETIEVAFLNGRQAPTIESNQSWNVDGVEYKVRLDFGVKAWDYRGILKNAGA